MRSRPTIAAALLSITACKPAPGTGAGADTVIHGATVSDPYRWLEDGASPRVTQWIAAQNARTDSVIGGFPEGPALVKRIGELAELPADRTSPTIRGRTMYYLREIPPQDQPVLVAAELPGGKERVVSDPNAMHAGINAYWPSPSGRLVAFTTTSGGDELATIHFADAITGKALPDTLPYASYGTAPPALAWDADEKGVSHTRFPTPAAGQPITGFDQAIYHHTLGTPSDTATLTGYSHIAEYRLVSSTDGAHAALLAIKGDGTTADVFFRTTSGWRHVIDDTVGVISAAFAGDRLLAVATNGTPRGRVVAVAPDGSKSVVLNEGPRAIQWVAPIAGGMLVVEDSGTVWRVEHYSMDGKLVRVVPLPAANISVTDIASSSDSPDAVIAWWGWGSPVHWQRYDARTGGLSTVFEVKPVADYSRVVAQVIVATSKDGTRVPVTVVSLKGTPQDGRAPAILTGYGGYGIPTAPAFIGTNLAWLERGGVLAIANIRGGSEFGEGWHKDGQKTHKQNVFDDFYAASQALVDTKWTTRDRLGIRGGSNGGLLMGAELTQHPDAFKAVLSRVGIYDMIRWETFPNGAYNTPEFGTVADSIQFAALLAYSPLHNVKPGTAYPAVLLETGINDTRVAPYQSRKFAAALEAATSSREPVLLLTRMGSGHGIGAPFAERVGATGLAMTFFAHELGLPTAPTASDARKGVPLKRSSGPTPRRNPPPDR